MWENPLSLWIKGDGVHNVHRGVRVGHGKRRRGERRTVSGKTEAVEKKEMKCLRKLMSVLLDLKC